MTEKLRAADAAKQRNSDAAKMARFGLSINGEIRTQQNSETQSQENNARRRKIPSPCFIHLVYLIFQAPIVIVCMKKGKTKCDVRKKRKRSTEKKRER